MRLKDGTRFTALVTDAGIYRDGELIAVIGVSINFGAALRPLLERSTDAALVLRSDGVVSYASPAVRQLFGWPAEQVIGRPVRDVYWLALACAVVSHRSMVRSRPPQNATASSTTAIFWWWTAPVGRAPSMAKCIRLLLQGPP